MTKKAQKKQYIDDEWSSRKVFFNKLGFGKFFSIFFIREKRKISIISTR